ncbi:MAG: hypothetical protein IJZ44_02160 [Lachnospiraceae bacterium]|nr:hypothetical protein [Lachnospiraceae bacterium]
MNVFNALKAGIVGIWNGIVIGIKNAINTMIYALNRMISGVVNGVNNVIGVLNGLSFTIPDWVPEWGGTNFGLNIGYLTAPRIPYLATGAVIPPNAPFMAVLGDQRHGTNIEAPLDTIKQAVAEVIGRQRLGGEKMVIHNVTQLNRRTLFEAFMDEAKLKQMQTGRNPFDMA